MPKFSPDQFVNPHSRSNNTKQNYMYHYKNYYSPETKPSFNHIVSNTESLTTSLIHDEKKDSNESFEKNESSKKANSRSFIDNLNLGNMFKNFNLPFNLDFISDSDSPILEVFGIELYIDDIIILCLLFILYKEETKDEMLFISLILLLLSN